MQDSRPRPFPAGRRSRALLAVAAAFILGAAAGWWAAQLQFHPAPGPTSDPAFRRLAALQSERDALAVRLRELEQRREERDPAGEEAALAHAALLERERDQLQQRVEQLESQLTDADRRLREAEFQLGRLQR